MTSPPSTRDLLVAAALTANAQRLAWQRGECPKNEFEKKWEAHFVPCLLETEASIQALLDQLEASPIAA